MKGALLPGTEPDPPHGLFDPGRFYDEHRDELLAFCEQLTQWRPRVDHEGLLHDTWLKLRDEHEQGRLDTSDPAKVVAWFKLVARRSVVDELRDGYLRFESLDPDLEAASSSDPKRAVNPAQQWADRATLRRAFEDMPPDLAEPFLYDDAGYSDKEIAEILGIGDGAVRMRLVRARAYLKRRLGVVAALVPVGAVAHAARSVRRAIGKPAQLVTSIGYVSVVLALAIPITPENIPAPPRAHGPIAQTPSAVRLDPAAPAGKDAMSRRGSPLDAARAAHRPLVRRSAPRPTLIPRLPRTCAPKICVGACPADQHQLGGDRLYLKPTGECGYYVTESAIPLCEYVADNPVVGCERTGDPQWQLGPPPSPIPKGEPL